MEELLPEVGSLVELCGLAKVEYNGKCAVVVSDGICGGERVAVEFWNVERKEFLRNKRIIQVRPKNLIVSGDKIDRATLLRGRASEIVKDRLFLGDCVAATMVKKPVESSDDPKWLKTLQSCKVVCCAGEMPKDKADIWVDLDDSVGESIEDKWDEAIDYIIKNLSPPDDDIMEAPVPVLAHCVRGKSRSAAVVMAALARFADSRDMDLKDAWQLVTRRRPEAMPNLTFTISLLRTNNALDLAHEPCFGLNTQRLEAYLLHPSLNENTKKIRHRHTPPPLR